MPFEDVLALIIEDDQLSVDVLQLLLDRLRVKSIVITDTRQIEDDLKNIDLPDVVFLDLEMPGYSGYDVLKIIQDNPDYAQVPVVVYTTHTSHLNEARTAGFHSFVGKPLDSRQFEDLLGRILNDEPVWEVP